MEAGHVAAATCGTPRTVPFAWEHEPGVSKLQSPAEAKKQPTSRRTTSSASMKKAEAPRLRVPLPPGGAGAPAMSPSPSASRRGVVRPEEDPFLAAYLACTASGRKAAGRGRDVGAQKLLGWAGLRLSLGLGLGASCKSSCGVVEGSVVRLPKVREADDRC
ncbi:uncharacterized protein [Lolium perenne]|uniref:uncharacterized protein n=1 Tax=Lolium perenne TaxID=4522 RepID=UPI0021EB175F|nr:uncharacterized protein LOC127348539 [Lolium perenne]